MIKLSQIALALLGSIVLIPLTFSGPTYARDGMIPPANLVFLPVPINSEVQSEIPEQTTYIDNPNIQQQSNNLISSLTVRVDINGVWESSEGTITFRESDSVVSGTYTQDNGVIKGVINDNVLNGYWIENNSRQRCSTPMDGRYYWGRAYFTFVGSNPNKLNGFWGYCNSDPTTAWSGSRVVPRR